MIIKCPYCRKNILGFLEHNTIAIRKAGGGTAYITAQAMQLACTCGYTFHVNEGTISREYAS